MVYIVYTILAANSEKVVLQKSQSLNSMKRQSVRGNFFLWLLIAWANNPSTQLVVYYSAYYMSCHTVVAMQSSLVKIQKHIVGTKSIQFFNPK